MTAKRNGRRLNGNGHKPPPKQAENRRKDASPLNGVVPPEEYRYQPGQPSPNPHGRPRKLRELQELIKDVMGESITSDITRIKAAIRLGLNKNPTIWLEYAFGKLPTPTHEMDSNEWRDWMKQNGYSDEDIDSLVAEFAAAMGRRRSGARSDKSTKDDDTD